MSTDAAVAAQVDAIAPQCDVGEEIYTTWNACTSTATHGIAWGVPRGVRKVALLCTKHHDVMMRNNQALVRQSVLINPDRKGTLK